MTKTTETAMNQTEIISSRPSNTVSVDLGTFTVTQVIRFPSGNFLKNSYPCASLPEARAWGRTLAREVY